jgi:hypothetical protein
MYNVVCINVTLLLIHLFLIRKHCMSKFDIYLITYIFDEPKLIMEERHSKLKLISKTRRKLPGVLLNQNFEYVCNRYIHSIDTLDAAIVDDCLTY